MINGIERTVKYLLHLLYTDHSPNAWGNQNQIPPVRQFSGPFHARFRVSLPLTISYLIHPLVALFQPGLKSLGSIICNLGCNHLLGVALLFVSSVTVASYVFLMHALPEALIALRLGRFLWHARTVDVLANIRYGVELACASFDAFPDRSSSGWGALGANHRVYTKF